MLVDKTEFEAWMERIMGELVAVAKEVFSRRRFVTYVELAEEIQSILEVKERTAKSYIRFMREKEIILKSSDNQSYYVIGNF